MDNRALAAVIAAALAACTGVLVWLGARQRARLGAAWADRVPSIRLNRFAIGVGVLAFSLIALVSYGTMIALGMIAAALLACRAAELNPWDALGLAGLRPATSLLLPPLVYLGILMPLYLSAVASFLLCAALHIPFEPQQLIRLFQRLDTPAQLAGFAVLAVVIAPISEEMFFRGLLHGWFKSFMPTRLSIAITSLLFGAVHWHAPAFLPLTLLGFSLAMIYETTRSLWPAIALHAIFNLATLAAMTLFPQLVGK
ncbi:MAG TPA: CPBP family intramembrane metalloprotease [Verrucomicrobiae bacterium]|nr:CPBP family intramembrane metalloprotease [Verrucomicrobiae bacterium]